MMTTFGPFILPAAIAVFICGIIADIERRRFPNTAFIILILIGAMYACTGAHGWQSCLAFVLMTMLGIVFHAKRLVESGDMKFLSVCMFYFNPFSLSLLLFIASLFFFSLFHCYLKSGKDAGTFLKQGCEEAGRLKYLVYGILPVSPSNMDAMDEREKQEKTLPNNYREEFSVVVGEG